MSLRKQLLLVSLLTLILPWAGCQFIAETESALRDGQRQMLNGTALAIADSLSQFPQELLGSSDSYVEDRLYAHALPAAPLIDGYVDDWSLTEASYIRLSGQDGESRLVLGQRGQHWYLFANVTDSSVQFKNTGDVNGDLMNFDHVALQSVSVSGEQSVFRFLAEAPGQLVAIREVPAVERQLDTRVAGVWRNTPSGYVLEARIPKALAGPMLGVTVVNATTGSDSPSVTNSFSTSEPGLVATQSAVLQSVARSYHQPGLRLLITDQDGYRVADAGDISTDDSDSDDELRATGWLRMIYSRLLEPGSDIALAEPDPTGLEQQDYIRGALNGTADGGWFRNTETGRAVVAVAQPIWSGTVQTGVVVLQQGTGAILSLTNRALSRLIVLTLIATVLVAAVLLGYASLLSFRIRRLSHAAEQALDDGRLQKSLPSARAGDEVGDLSRSFSNVLRQLGTYNDYLRGLAGKLSHELRTPLTIVRSSLENLEHETLSAPALEYTTRAREGTDRLQSILAAMSEASRTEELIENAEPERFDLAAVLRSAVAAYGDAWATRRFELLISTDESTIYGSPELLMQMLDKLVDNAVDFSSDDDTIDLRLEREQEDVVISVSNPGPHLPEKMQTQLFDSMVSVRGKHSDQHLGFGLFIARLIVEGHRGSIEARNTESGVCFQVRLPANISS